MYNIAVCDDEKAFSEQFSAQVTAILEERNLLYHLDVYDSCDALYKALERRECSYHIYFLDILMEGMDGMDFAHRLREIDEASTIIFVTCTHDYIKQGYDVAARQYIEKPVDPQELRALLLQDYERRFQKQYLTVRQGASIRSVPVGEIVCLEAKGRKLLYHLLHETIAVSASDRFDVLADKLPDGFVRCHRSYYLYIDNIQKLQRTEAIAKNSQLVPVSRSYYQEVQRAFMQYVRRISYATSGV